VDLQEAHIRQEIEHTREAMSAKVAMIHERVEGTVDDTGSAIASTVNTVLAHIKQVQDMIENVTSTVDTTMERVQEATHHTLLDGKPGVEFIAELHQRPWIMLGAAVLAGYILGSGSRSAAALNPATANSASGANPHICSTDNPTGNVFISPTAALVGSQSTPTAPHKADPAGPS
jgi:hypothetical protein